MADGQIEDDAWLHDVSKLLTWKEFVQVRVEYMGFNVTDLLNILEEVQESPGKAKIEALKDFRNRSRQIKEETDPKKVGYMIKIILK